MKKRIINAIIPAICLLMLILFYHIWANHNPSWTLTQYPDMSGNQGLFYTIKNNKSGELIVIDGGWEQNADAVRAAIKEQGNDKVDTWIVTHYHNDHVGAFNTIFADPQGIKIDKIYAPDIDEEVYHEIAKDWDMPEYMDRFVELTKDDERLVHPNRSDVIEAAGLRIKFYNTYDDVLLDTVDKYEGDIPNNASLVFKVSGNEDSVLFFADAHSAEMAELFMKMYPDEMHADYVQLAHHGTNSLPRDFYLYIAPKTVLFDAGEWLMNDPGHDAKDYAVFFDDNNIKRYDYRTGINGFILR